MFKPLGALLLASFLVSPLAASAEGVLRTISVSGNGTAERVPDVAYVTLGVSVRGPVVATVLQEANLATQSLLDRLAELGLQTQDIQTSGLQLIPEFQMNADNTATEIKGYLAANSVTITVRDLPALGDILTDAVNSGANTIDGVNFGIEDNAAALDEARTTAVADAIHRATIYATAANVELGDITMLSEGGVVGAPMYRVEAIVMDSGVSETTSVAVPVSPGTISVAANVSMTFEIAD